MNEKKERAFCFYFIPHPSAFILSTARPLPQVVLPRTSTPI